MRWGRIMAVAGVALAAQGAFVWLGRGERPRALPAPLPERREPERRDPAPAAGRAPQPGTPNPAATDPAAPARRAGEVLEGALGLLSRSARGALERREALHGALDEDAPALDRVRALRALGRLADSEALDVIERVLRGDASPELRYHAAAALGEAEGRDAAALLGRLLAGDDVPARLGAIRALGDRGVPDDIAQLRRLLLNPAELPAAREQAARALAGLGGREVASALGHVALGGDDALRDAALASLAARPFAQAEPALRALLGTADLAPGARRALLEALSESGAGAAPLLLEYARPTQQSELRVAAIESLALLQDVPGIADALSRLSLDESDPQIRSELYEALALHADWSAENADLPDRLRSRVLAETEPRARLHGTRMLAARLRSSRDPALAESFDRELLPWVAARAVDPSADPHERLLQVDALKLAGTPAARDALLSLARTGDAVTAPAAERALAFPPLR